MENSNDFKKLSLSQPEKAETVSPQSARARRLINDWVDGAVAILNGCAGDYINEQESHLAIPMSFYHDKRPLPLTTGALSQTFPKATPRICILVHGLCYTERIWEFPGDTRKNYGSLLQRDLGYTPFFVRYNSGLHVSQNGKSLSHLLTQLLAVYPQQVEEIILIGHSMGGLVIRSACHYDQTHNSNLTKPVSRIFFLGTPQLGAPLEKFVNALTFGLRSTRIPFARSLADFLNFRSAAIKDLRFGYTVDAEWKEHDPDALLQNNRHPVPLLPGVSHYLIAATLTREPDHPLSQCLGDVLVRIPSATRQSQGSREDSSCAIEHRAIISGVNHFALARHPAVYRQIKSWCRDDPELISN